MTPDSTADVAIKNSNIAVNRIFTNVKSTVQNVKVNVTKLSSRPSYISAAPDGTIYQYNDVTLTNLAASNINSANLRFNVTKSWLTANGYDYSHVSLYRYTDKWSKLTTTKISESSASYEFEANTPGFSVFVIAAYKQAVTTPEANVTTPPANETGVGTGTGTQTNKTQEQAGTQANKTQEQAAPKTETGIGTAISQDIMYVILVILVAAVLFVIYSVMLKKKTAGYEYKAKK
jgi:PGF-pre-PGF domain-containing protein